MSVAPERDRPELTAKTQAIWDQNAAWWDDKIGEGNAFQQQLVGPATERLLEVRPGENVLDLACGNGLFSRRLAQLGGRVLACDFSPSFLERARARTTEHADRIEYRLVDVTDKQQLLGLGERRFDAAVCGMALMDIATVTPLMESLPVLLKPGGRFVFSVLHPCFNSSGCTMVMEREEREGELRTTHAVKVTRYLALGPEKGIGIVGQPAAHYYFHRPLSVLFTACFEAGFVLNGLEEPAFGEATAAQPLDWKNFKDIPPVLVARVQLPAAAGPTGERVIP
ncbi:MAG TPA: class I SAM-dependent methyltransferase [Gemmataceae bacterium]|jgi:2-polyprenyl-3-methyl-5-hydroxy-6-metoxy-1,4-benzoquinol methylase|nr:class I SAM-dependent methyltransferase [Gemmataceae bacterium]